MRLLLVALRFDGEIDDCASNLNSFIIAREQRRAALDKNQRSKLALVVLKHEAAVLQLDLCVAARDRYVVYAEVGLMAAPQLEDIFMGSGPNNVYDATSVFFLVKRLQHHVVSTWGPLVLCYVEFLVCGLYHERVGLLADLTLECLPEVAAEVVRILGLALHLQPVLQALKVDCAHRALAAANLEERILVISLALPAEAALQRILVLRGLGLHNRLLNVFELFEKLVVRLVVDGVSRMAPLALGLQLFTLAIRGQTRVSVHI